MLEACKYLPLWKSQTWPPRRHHSLKLFWKCPQFCAIHGKNGSGKLENTVVGIKHSCTRSKVNSENFTLDLVQQCYSENLNIIIVLHFSISRCFIYLGKPFEIKIGLRHKHCEQGLRHISNKYICCINYLKCRIQLVINKCFLLYASKCSSKNL